MFSCRSQALQWYQTSSFISTVQHRSCDPVGCREDALHFTVVFPACPLSISVLSHPQDCYVCAHLAEHTCW